MTIHYQPDRQGMTVYPDQIDEATGQPIEGSSEVVDTRVANLAKEDLNYDGQSPDAYEEIDHLSEEELIDANPDYIPETISEVELASISDEIHQSSISPDAQLADSIASVDLGDSAADVTVQFLSHKVYNGDITAEEAFNEAINSGIPPEALASSFKRLQSYFK